MAVPVMVSVPIVVSRPVVVPVPLKMPVPVEVVALAWGASAALSTELLPPLPQPPSSIASTAPTAAFARFALIRPDLEMAICPTMLRIPSLCAGCQACQAGIGRSRGARVIEVTRSAGA